MRMTSMFGLIMAAMLCAAPSVAQEGAGQVLRVQYPTEGARDILIHLDADGAVRAVTGGAGAVSSFYAGHDRLNFNAVAITRWGPRPMAFAMEKVGAIYSGVLLITGECVRNCLRPVTATPEGGAPR